MTECLEIGCCDCEAGAGGRGELVRERVGRAERRAEGERVARRSVVDDQGCVPTGDAAERSRTGGPADLVGADNRERDTNRVQQGMHRRADRRLGEPHAGRFAPEPTAEVRHAPAKFREGVPLGREREDDVVIRVRNGGPADAVPRHDPIMDDRRVLLEPAGQCRPEVEAHALEQVDDCGDAPLVVVQTRGGARRVALGSDALVPVAERRRTGFHGHHTRAGVPPRWLIGVAVQCETERHDGQPPVRDAASQSTPSGGRSTTAESCCPCQDEPDRALTVPVP
ncbi:unannotated protein [freshwater metagenome]